MVSESEFRLGRRTSFPADRETAFFCVNAGAFSSQRRPSSAAHGPARRPSSLRTTASDFSSTSDSQHLLARPAPCPDKGTARAKLMRLRCEGHGALKSKHLNFSGICRGAWRRAMRDEVTTTKFRHGDDGKSRSAHPRTHTRRLHIVVALDAELLDFGVERGAFQA